MTKTEQAFQNWLRAECPDLPDSILGTALTQSFKKAFEAGYEAHRAEENKTSPNPIFCEHANEVPARCPCEEGCYCKTHTCAKKTGNWVEGHTKRFSVEMRLCESSRVFLKPNVGYIFTVDPNCPECVWLSAKSRTGRLKSPTDNSPRPNTSQSFQIGTS